MAPPVSRITSYGSNLARTGLLAAFLGFLGGATVDVTVEGAALAGTGRSRAHAARAARPGPLTMAAIPGGTFVMGAGAGDPEGRPEEKPAHRVTLAAYLMGATEVTQGLYREITGENPSYFTIGDDLPVERVTWGEALLFCNALSRREGLQEAYIIESGRVGWIEGASGYRLPTEAEWEYACRAGTSTPYVTGDCLGTGNANYDGDTPAPTCPGGLNRGQPLPVASLPPNAWGIHDLHGNILEWCWDRHGAYAPGPVVNPIGPGDGAEMVVRGGSWYSPEIGCRSAVRYGFSPGSRADFIGFRVVRSGDPGR